MDDQCFSWGFIKKNVRCEEDTHILFTEFYLCVSCFFFECLQGKMVALFLYCIRDNTIYVFGGELKYVLNKK